MAKVSAPFVRSSYNYDVMAVSDETGLRCDDPSLAQQHFKDQCDINNIVDSFLRTGELPQANITPQYGDFTGVSDFHSALTRIRATEAEFNALHPAIRAKFDNDPAKLLNYVLDPKNYEDAIKLGLLPPEEDLSPAAGAASSGEAQAAGGKSGGGRKAPLPTAPKGFKLVPEGDDGEA